MSYQEKRTFVDILSSIMIIGGYCIYAFSQYQAGNVTVDNLKYFAVTMLVFIGIGIVLAIIANVVFHVMLAVTVAAKNRNFESEKVEQAIANEMVEDEMDHVIELKATRFTLFVCMGGFITGLVLVALDVQAAIALNVVFVAAGLGSVTEGIMKLYYYKTGVING